ncbi:MAG: BON domain-containing protein [Gemmatimonadota bacterium]|nr:BON domain-containing protein [Gemmatimonadota bacterium]
MKTDTELKQAIMAEFEWEPSIRAPEVGVAVRDGVVTLSGTVDTYAQKFAAERAVERVAGIRAVAEELEVISSGEHKKADPDIARAAANVLLWDVEVPNDRVKAIIRNGWVTLEGAVDWFFQKAAAERAVRNLEGVKGIVSQIEIKPPTAKTAQVKADIEAALLRTAAVDAKAIHVETSDGTVTLRGTVRSVAERDDAERAAWNAPGVNRVKDELQFAI